MTQPSKPIGRLLATGLLSAALYALVYWYETEIMQMFARGDGAYWLLPVITAFVFSFVHGAFTGYFWDVLGVRAKSAEK